MKDITKQIIEEVEAGKHQTGIGSHQTIRNIPNLVILQDDNGYYWSAYAMEGTKEEESIGNVLTELSMMILLENELG